MARKLFITLAVKNLPETRVFWSGLGFTFDEQFSDENSACMLINETACVMLLAEPFWKLSRRQIEGQRVEWASWEDG